MLQGLGLKTLVDTFLKKVENALHLNDLVKQVEQLLDPKLIGNSRNDLSNHVTSASKVYEVSIYVKFKQVAIM